jgi:hypothetical protein
MRFCIVQVPDFLSAKTAKECLASPKRYAKAQRAKDAENALNNQFPFLFLRLLRVFHFATSALKISTYYGERTWSFTLRAVIKAHTSKGCNGRARYILNMVALIANFARLYH